MRSRSALGTFGRKGGLRDPSRRRIRRPARRGGFGRRCDRHHARRPTAGPGKDGVASGSSGTSGTVAIAALPATRCRRAGRIRVPAPRRWRGRVRAGACRVLRPRSGTRRGDLITTNNHRVTQCSKIHFESATRLMSRLDAREIGARELLEHFLGRVERHNPTINAIVWQDADRARAEADASDRRRAAGAGRPAPLDGLPVTVKESFDLAGSPTTWGVPEHARRHRGHGLGGGREVPRRRRGGLRQDQRPVHAVRLAELQHHLRHLRATRGTSPAPPGAPPAARRRRLAAGSDRASTPARTSAPRSATPPITAGSSATSRPGRSSPAAARALPGDHAHPPTSRSSAPLARSAADLKLALGLLAGADGPAARGWRLTLPEPRRRNACGITGFGVLLSDPQAEVERSCQDAIAALARLAGRRRRGRRDGREARLPHRRGDGGLHHAAPRRDLQADERRDDRDGARGLSTASRRTRSPTAAACSKPRPCSTATGSGGTSAATS